MLTKEILESGIKPIQIDVQLNTAVMEDISDATYFGPKYKSYVSNSRLGLINPLQDGSPKAYFEGLSKHNKASDSLVSGSAVHGLVLQPESYVLCDSVDRPTAKLGYVADACYMLSDHTGKMVSEAVVSKCAKQFDYYSGDVNKFKKFLPDIANYIKQRAAYESSGNKTIEPIYLSQKQRDSVRMCVDSLLQNFEVTQLLHPADDFGTPLPTYNEHTILMDVIARFPDGDEVPLSLKSKLDNFTVDEDSGLVTVNDVKTTSRFCSDFENAFVNFHYYREFGMYAFMVTHYLKNLGKSISSVKGNCLVVETTTSDHKSSVYNVTPAMLARGMKEFSILLKMVAYYTKYGY